MNWKIEEGSAEDVARLEKLIAEFEKPYPLAEIEGRIRGSNVCCLLAFSSQAAIKFARRLLLVIPRSMKTFICLGLCFLALTSQCQELPEQDQELLQQLQAFEAQILAHTQSQIEQARDKAINILKQQAEAATTRGHHADAHAIESVIQKLQSSFTIEIPAAAVAPPPPQEFAEDFAHVLFSPLTWKGDVLPGEWDARESSQNWVNMKMKTPIEAFGILPESISARAKDGTIQNITIFYLGPSRRAVEAYFAWSKAYHAEINEKHGPRAEWPIEVKQEVYRMEKENRSRIDRETADPSYDQQFDQIESALLDALEKMGGSPETRSDQEIVPGVRQRTADYTIGPTVISFHSKTRSAIFIMAKPVSQAASTP